MLVHPNFDPVAVQFGPYTVGGHVLGPFAVHWYGITYMVAFATFYLLASRRVRQAWFAREGWDRTAVEDLLFYGVLGVILGGRIGYVLFYDLPTYTANPLRVFAVWQGGMSFHGGMLGVAVAMAAYAWRHQRPWLQVTDLIAPCVPLGLGSGRIGNFINGELWGRAADPSLPWAMIFPNERPVPIPRHPSQLYQFTLEGVLLFVFLWWYGRQERGRGQVTGMFVFGYGLQRFVVEFFREPDAQLEWLAASTGLSMGQWLCVPMIVGGLALWAWGRGRDLGGAARSAASAR